MGRTTRRMLRAATAVTGVVVLSLAIAAPSIAASPTGSDRVGAPERLLVESVHAAGKVLEISNDGAQMTGPSEAPWQAAAAIFARASDPAELSAQAVVAYPVTAASDTYILTSAEGEVLTRKHNDDPHYRYLELSDLTVAEAADEPRAQWRVVDAGGGAVYVHNVAVDGSGRTPALDMYNWRTDDGAEIQTYDAGTAAVQKWVLHDLDAEVESFAGRTDLGSAPTLPASLAARYSWGQRHTLEPIQWQTPDSSAWETEGTVVVPGTATGLFGEPVPVTAEYLVGSLGDAADIPLRAYVGMSVKELQMSAPARVDRPVSGSDVTVSSPVTWDWSVVTDAVLAQEGTFTIPAAAGTGFEARLIVTVTATGEVNLLRQGGVHHTYTHKDATAFALTDGVRNRLGFADWRSGGAANRVNPNTVTFYFDVPRQVTGAGVYDIGGTRNIGAVTVQYRTVTGGWRNLPAAGVTWPAPNGQPDLALDVDSERVLATGVRVIVTNKTADTWMSLSEIEVLGPDLPSGR